MQRCGLRLRSFLMFPAFIKCLMSTVKILYIGKAISLRNRVRSYFQDNPSHTERTRAMVARVRDFRTIVVTSDVEALILEANLIYLHQPPYNVRLRDGKNFPYLRLTNEPYPRLAYTRTVQEDGGRYFGLIPMHVICVISSISCVPSFPSVHAVSRSMGRRARPCLQYHIKRCLAPCVGYQTESEYDAVVDEVEMFLDGRHDTLIARVQHEMLMASEQQHYEAAARLRDRLMALRRVSERQRVVWRSKIEMDLLALARAQGQACVQVFFVRDGKLLGQDHFLLDGVDDQSDAQIFAQFISQFYGSVRAGDAARKGRQTSVRGVGTTGVIPKELLLTVAPQDAPILETWLSQMKGQRVRILQPQRGERAAYLDLVRENAEQNLKTFLAHQEAQESASAQSLSELAAALGLPSAPRRIECYDISNIQGTNATASMVVFVDGRSKKSAYRRFNIRYDRGPNDFAMMQEALRRRLRYLQPGATDDAATRSAKAERFHERPDLLLIDGGKGQLHAVVEVLEELNLQGIPIAGLAKEHEWLYVPEQSEPIVLAPHSAGLHLVMRVRDEAHRFAITAHRKLRAKAMVHSALDEVEGIGPTRRRRLLKSFGSIAALSRASLDEIGAVPGMTLALAARVKASLASDSDPKHGGLS